jgi:hypothetical protein
MSEVSRYTIYENISIYIPCLGSVDYLSERIEIKNSIFTVYASLTNPYSWDGASPKLMLNGRVYGTPDFGDKLKLPTLVHDLLYTYKPVSRKLSDYTFYYLLKLNNFKFSKTYYLVVRLLGWLFFYKK